MEKVEEMMTVAICLGAIEGSLDTLKSFNVNDAIFKNNISEMEKAKEQLEKQYKSFNVNDVILKNNISEMEKAKEQLEKQYKSLNNLV